MDDSMRENADVIPQNCPFAWGLDPNLILWAHPSQYPERHRNRFSRGNYNRRISHESKRIDKEKEGVYRTNLKAAM